MIIALHNLVWFKVEEALTPFLACAWLVLLADLSSVAPFSSLSALTYTALHCSSSAMLQVAVAWLVYRDGDVDTLLSRLLQRLIATKRQFVSCTSVDC